MMSNLFWGISIPVVILGTFITLTFIPLFNIPNPEGSYSLGTMYFTLRDSSRNDTISKVSSGIREIHTQVWYPAKLKGSEKRDIYIPSAKKFSKIFATSQGIFWFPFVLNHLGKTRTNSYLNAQIEGSGARYPVVVFSHGLGQFYKFNTILIEELASNGYIVIAISHPFDTPCTINSKNELIEYKTREKNTRAIDTSELSTIFKRISVTDDLSELRELYKVFYNSMPVTWNQQNKNWVQDILFTIRELNSINFKEFKGCMDLKAIGVLGFSFGGGASGLAAMSDTTIKAGINLDGWQPGHLNNNYFNCPFMFISSEEHKGANDFFLKYSEHKVFDLTIEGTKHPNFNDMAIILGKTGRFSGLTGKIEGGYGLDVIEKLVINFFDLYLKKIENIDIVNCLEYYQEIHYQTNTR